MYRVLYAAPDVHVYDLASSLGKLALSLGKYKPARRTAFRAAQLMESVDRILPGVNPRKLLRAAESLAPEGRRLIRFRKSTLGGRIDRATMGKVVAGLAQPTTFRGKVIGVDVMVPRYKRGKVALPTAGATTAHELGHAVRMLQGTQLKRKTTSSRFFDEVLTNRVGADIYKKAGGNRLRYWASNFPALLSYYPKAPTIM